MIFACNSVRQNRPRKPGEIVFGNSCTFVSNDREALRHKSKQNIALKKQICDIYDEIRQNCSSFRYFEDLPVQWSPLHGYCKEMLTLNTCMDIQTILSYHLAVIQAEWIVSIQVSYKNVSESWSLWLQMRFPLLLVITLFLLCGCFTIKERKPTIGKYRFLILSDFLKPLNKNVDGFAKAFTFQH